jgi:hypothetical protein
MELKLISLKLPILPLNSIGGVEPGGNIKLYEDSLNEFFSRDITLTGISNRVVCINYLEGLLKINVDLFSGHIYKVEAGERYLGNIARFDIKIGIFVKDLLKYFPNDWQDDGFRLWNIRFPGLYFSFFENDDNEFLSSSLPNYLDYKIVRIGMIAPDDNGDYDRYGEDWYILKERLIEMWTV